MPQRRQRQRDSRLITVRSLHRRWRAIRGTCSISRRTNGIAGGGDETGDPQRSAQENTERKTRPSYTGKPKGAGGLSFFDRNCGRTKRKRVRRLEGFAF